MCGPGGCRGERDEALMGFGWLLVLAALAAIAVGALNFGLAWKAGLWVGRLVFALSIAPFLILLAYCAALVGLAIRTGDERYAFVDIGFGIVLLATLIWVPIVYWGFRLGRARRAGPPRSFS